MNVRPEQLASHCRKGLKSVYLIHGDEPLLMEESLDTIRRAAVQQEFLERTRYQTDRSFDWGAIVESTQSLSLFAERKLIELRLSSPKIGTAGSKALVEFCDASLDDTILVIASPRIDLATQKGKWFKRIDQIGCVVTLWPVERRQLPNWIAQRAQGMSLQLEKSAIEFLAERVDGNLLAAKQELDHIQLLYPTQVVTAEQLENMVSDGSQFNVFNLSDAYLARNTSYALRILRRMASEGIEPMSILWTLHKDICTLEQLLIAQKKGESINLKLKQLRVIKKKQQPFENLARSLSTSETHELLKLSKSCDDTIKGLSKCNVWHNFDDMIRLICSTPS